MSDTSAKQCSPHGWTLDTLEKYLSSEISGIKETLREQDDRNRERFAAAKEQVTLALVGADKAITKADIATEKRFEGVNEFRQTLADQASNLMPRAEYTVQHQALSEKVGLIDTRFTERVTLVDNRLLKLETSGFTKTEIGAKNVSTIVAIVSVAYGVIASFGILATFLLRH